MIDAALLHGWSGIALACTAVEAVELAKDDPACRMVNRNQGSGTRILIDRLLGGARPAGYAVQSSSHNAVAAAVSQRRADWGVPFRWRWPTRAPKSLWVCET